MLVRAALVTILLATLAEQPRAAGEMNQTTAKAYRDYVDATIEKGGLQLF